MQYEVQTLTKSINKRIKSQQKDFAQFARNFRATIKNNTQHTYYMVARKFRASCVKSSCRDISVSLNIDTLLIFMDICMQLKFKL